MSPFVFAHRVQHPSLSLPVMPDLVTPMIHLTCLLSCALGAIASVILVFGTAIILPIAVPFLIALHRLSAPGPRIF